MRRLASYHPTDLRLRKVLRDGRAGPGRCCYPRPPQRVHRRCKRERAEASVRLIRYRPCPGQPGSWAEWRMRRGLWRKCGRQLDDASLACGPACGQHDLQNVPGPIPARDRDGAGLETVEEMLDQGGTSYVDRAIARGGERGSLGCRARRVTDPARAPATRACPVVSVGTMVTPARGRTSDPPMAASRYEFASQSD
jgi:hypothetical protein